MRLLALSVSGAVARDAQAFLEESWIHLLALAARTAAASSVSGCGPARRRLGNFFLLELEQQRIVDRRVVVRGGERCS